MNYSILVLVHTQPVSASANIHVTAPVQKVESDCPPVVITALEFGCNWTVIGGENLRVETGTESFDLGSKS